ncbi:hypothetical protein BKE38_09885 [Pseudoroseomonas deserti]|uniref:Transposase n=1 Tax=Teichococcus deserti TaxID=1817963 RepID=A0A1V2H4J3_9PROT|nr:hypothetical protein [Pseudoroseomonas deserti]ONG54803.1 hypothetical protein BKE38_09885 [Pseudoroseomonas deserti]
MSGCDNADPAPTVGAARLRLGVPRSTLYRWQGQAEGFRMPSFTEVLAEKAELRRRLKQLDR